MKATIRRWGRSAAVRIPASVMHAVRLKPGEEVEVREEAGRIVIEPPKQESYDLRKLLKGITLENQHEPIDFGKVVGKEASSWPIR